MKQVLIAILMMTGIQASAASELRDLFCENNMYRQAELNVYSGSYLELADDHVIGAQVLLEKLAKDHNLGESIFSQSIRLQIPVEDLKCQTLGQYPMSCVGESTEATLTLQAWTGDGEVTFRRRVPAKNLKITGSLGTEGPIAVGATPTVVSLHNYYIQLEADVTINGLTSTLQFNTFFYTKPEGQASHCRLKP